MSDLVALWPAKASGKFAKADAVGLAQLLDKFGVGVEPDVRLGGPAQSTGPAVLFRTTAAQSTTATPEYTAATTLLHLAAVVSAADDDVSTVERDHLVSHLESSLHLTPGERIRLTAHLDWLLASKLKLTGLTKRLGALTDAQRAHVAEFATAIAAVDGVVSPGEVDTLRKIYKLLGQEPDLVYSELHALTAASTLPAPATEPVAVVPADTGPTGYLIPPPKHGPPAGVVRLDPRPGGGQDAGERRRGRPASRCLRRRTGRGGATTARTGCRGGPRRFPRLHPLHPAEGTGHAAVLEPERTSTPSAPRPVCCPRVRWTCSTKRRSRPPTNRS